MKRFAIPASLVVAAVGLQLLSNQPAEAKGWKHHMRDRFARQRPFYANPATYGYGANYNMRMNSGYGWHNNVRFNPRKQFGYGNYPAYQNYRYGQGSCR